MCHVTDMWMYQGVETESRGHLCLRKLSICHFLYFKLIPRVRESVELKICSIIGQLFIGGDLGRKRRMHHIDPNGPTAAGEAHKGTAPRFHRRKKSFKTQTGYDIGTYMSLSSKQSLMISGKAAYVMCRMCLGMTRSGDLWRDKAD